MCFITKFCFPFSELQIPWNFSFSVSLKTDDFTQNLTPLPNSKIFVLNADMKVQFHQICECSLPFSLCRSSTWLDLSLLCTFPGHIVLGRIYKHILDIPSCCCDSWSHTLGTVDRCCLWRSAHVKYYKI